MLRKSPHTMLRCCSNVASVGFTLIELMVTIAVLAILLALAVPSFSGIVAQNRLTSQTNELVAGLYLAKSEALRRGHAVTLLSASNNNVFSAWQVITDKNADGAAAGTVTDEDGTVLRDNAASGGTTVLRGIWDSGVTPSFTAGAATDRFVTFNPRGGATPANVFFRICSSTSTAVKGRIVQVSTVGKIAVVATNAACS